MHVESARLNAFKKVLDPDVAFRPEVVHFLDYFLVALFLLGAFIAYPLVRGRGFLVIDQFSHLMASLDFPDAGEPVRRLH